MKVIREETKQECQGEGVATTDEEVGEDSSRGEENSGFRVKEAKKKKRKIP